MKNKSILIIMVILIVVQAVIPLLLKWLNLAGQDYSNVIFNAGFLLACFGLIRFLKLPAEDIGLKIDKGRLVWHVAICLAIFLCDMLFYVLAIQISSLRPISSKTTWGILNYLLVAFAEEIYFRGILYGALQKRFSGKAGLFVSSIIFSLVHFRQGLGMLARLFTGFLFGSVRYSSGMIFLLIIPVHFAYNVVWLLFEGNWENQPQWAQFFPLFEMLMGLIIAFGRTLIVRSKRAVLQQPS